MTDYSTEFQSAVSVPAINILGSGFRGLVQFIQGKRSIDAVGEVASVSGTKLVWLCTISQDGGVGIYFIYILRGCRVLGKNLIRFSSQEVKPDDQVVL